MEEKRKDALRFLMPFPGRHKREIAPGAPAQAGKGRSGGRKWIKPVVFLLIIGAATAVTMTQRGMKAKTAITRVQSRNTVSAGYRDISSELSSSGTLKAKDTYSIISMVEREILSTGFEEGDQVEKDQVLYETDRSNMESQLTSSVNSLTRSQSSYEDALENCNDVLNDCSGNTYKATDIGCIKKLYISVGDRVSENTELADVYSSNVMEIRIPFLSGGTVIIGAGMPAAVTLTDTGEQVIGTIEAVANQETVLTGERLVRVITIQMPNPDGLTTSLGATAQIGEFINNEDRVFETSMDATMNADLSTSVEVGSLLVSVGGYVTRGTPVFEMTDKSADKLIQSYEGAPDKTGGSAKSTQNRLDGTQGSYGNYTIETPTSGQVITKNFKVRGNITENSSNTTILTTIYDLSNLTFEIPIGELDIKKVKVGQKVEISADTFEGQTFSDTVIDINLESTYSNGVSTYPVVVTLDDMGDLSPGMNVNGVITLKKTNDVLAIPADALMRGDQVYVRDDTVTEQRGPVPAEFRTVKVETGLTSNTLVEIESGLSEGGMIYVAESSKNSSSIMMMVDDGMGGPPEGGGNMRGGNRGRSEEGRQNR